MSTLAAVGFIAAVAAVGVFVGTRPTVADGGVLASELLPSLQAREPRIERMACAPEVPIGVAGAVFRCTVSGDPRTFAPIALEWRMDRAGALSYRVVGRDD